MAFFEESGSVVAVDATPTHISNYHEAALAAIAENESNYNVLMQAVGLHESKLIRESGEAVYTEGALSSFWEKVKKFFMSVLAKIKGIFHSFMSRFDAQFKSGKNFFDKYKKELAEKLAKMDKDKVKFVGYNFTHLTGNTTLTGSGSAFTAIADKSAADGIIARKDKIEDEIETYRGTLIGGGSHTSSEFSKELFSYFRGGDTTKSEVDNVDMAYFTTILGTDKASKTVKDSYKALEKSLEAEIKACERAGKESVDAQVKDSTDTTAQSNTAAYPILIQLAKGKISAGQAFIGAQMQAIASQVSQAKQFASQVVRAAVKESAGWQHYGESTDDFLGNVKFQ